MLLYRTFLHIIISDLAYVEKELSITEINCVSRCSFLFLDSGNQIIIWANIIKVKDILKSDFFMSILRLF